METAKTMAALLGLSAAAVNHQIRKLFPGISRCGKRTCLSDEQVKLLKDWNVRKGKKISGNSDNLTITDLAEKLGWTRPLTYYRIKRLFPECILGGKQNVYLTPEQAELLKNRCAEKEAEKKAKKEAEKEAEAAASRNALETRDSLTVKDLVERFKCCDEVIRARIKECFPRLAGGGNKKIYLTPEQAEHLGSRIKKPRERKPKPAKPAAKNPQIKPVEFGRFNRRRKDPDLNPAPGEPDIKALKAIQAEETARRAAKFRKWYQENRMSAPKKNLEEARDR